MHMICFAGLRGAVAYACVRDFPALYGHNDEFIAATVVIVLVTIIVMGGAIEPLLQYLEIRMNVDEEEYMQEWHKMRKLKGAFHAFGKSIGRSRDFPGWNHQLVTHPSFLCPDRAQIYLQRSRSGTI